MEISFDLKNRTMCVNLSDGNSFRVELNLLSLFLVANLFATLTWLIPGAHKAIWIKDLQKHLDMAEDVEFETTNIVHHGTTEAEKD